MQSLVPSGPPVLTDNCVGTEESEQPLEGTRVLTRRLLWTQSIHSCRAWPRQARRLQGAADRLLLPVLTTPPPNGSQDSTALLGWGFLSSLLHF